MRVEIQKLDKLKRKLKIEVSGKEFSKEKEEFYKQTSKNLKVPGFRPGTAPLDLIEKHHGKALREEFVKKSIPQFYRKALEEEKILPASMPKIYDLDLKDDSMVFFAEFETRPELKIDESVYKGIKIKEKIEPIKEIEIEKIITNLKDGIKRTLNKDLADDDIAKWASYANANALREAIKAQLHIEKIRERRQKIDNQIKQHLLKNVKVDLPAEEVKRHLSDVVDRQMYSLQQRGTSKEDVEKYRKDLEEKLKDVATDEVKLFYILEAIAKQEGIKIDNNLGEVILGLILSQAQYSS